MIYSFAIIETAFFFSSSSSLSLSPYPSLFFLRHWRFASLFPNQGRGKSLITVVTELWTRKVSGEECRIVQAADFELFMVYLNPPKSCVLFLLYFPNLAVNMDINGGNCNQLFFSSSHCLFVINFFQTRSLTLFSYCYDFQSRASLHLKKIKHFPSISISPSLPLTDEMEFAFLGIVARLDVFGFRHGEELNAFDYLFFVRREFMLWPLCKITFK